ncbi:PHP domain-containing protein [Clostridium celatum]|uniref:PHP domain protein n=1 Tax=Clostridium celatum DSM 1785 TaxID=545697 RepID=L1QEL8_9CLOT|nr:PHP domain-containing protein [Clostridium celatum]EKY26130.1 PHP domain protein [Clostridium celatum DSM 1785]MCE9654271.1 PHP domain-containing protein [Clostridium celatum]MDU3723655.1 PHP domain-containing protein [Clostridium celatum]MDU6294688.1 PHP domain-containing protein [Clostridium celatum]MDY3362068.1 PHP domain-containing protein [Clostridium celatum]
MVICDLHTHSTASDGKFSPSEVVKKAYDRGVKYLALTDHDTLSGIQEAKETAEKLDIHFIPGVELSTTYKGETIHILGYFRGDDYKNVELNNFLEDLKTKRIARAHEIVRRLKKFNDIEIDVNEVLKNGKDTIARPHIAKAIMDAGYNYTKEYIFDNFIGDHCPAYIPANKLATEEGIALLRKYNALVILAHPVLLKKLHVLDVLHLDFDGIEGIYGLNTKEDTERFLKIVDQKNILTSCGSDSHGYEEDDKKHGFLGSQSIEENRLNKFIDALNN